MTRSRLTSALVFPVACAGLTTGAALLASGCGSSGGWTPDRARAVGGSAYERGDYAEALEQYEAYLAVRPGSPQANYDVGRTLAALGRSKEAREHLTIAHQVEPQNPVYLEALAKAMIDAGEVESALRMLRDRAAERPTADSFLVLGRGAEYAGLADEAEIAFTTVTRIDPPTEPRGWRGLADLYQSIGDEARELETLRVLVGIEPVRAKDLERARQLGGVIGPTFAKPAPRE